MSDTLQSKSIYHGLPVFPQETKGLTAIVTGANGMSGDHMVCWPYRSSLFTLFPADCLNSCVFYVNRLNAGLRSMPYPAVPRTAPGQLMLNICLWISLRLQKT